MLSRSLLKVGINNTALDGKAGAPVRFVASTKPTPGPGVKSNLSWTLSLFSFRFGSFPWAEFWVRSQEEWFEFRSHTQTVSHNNVFQSCCITGVKGNHIKMLFFCWFFFQRNLCIIARIPVFNINTAAPVNAPFFTQCISVAHLQLQRLDIHQ